ncbi:MAG: protein lplB [Clostridiales bacterium]|nr:sugar ABC transporter permease [Clostridiales bacterium]PWM41072.1 MAG: protein lplB [Clostridiales bacterium]
MIAFQGKSLARESRWRRLGKSIWKNRMIYMLLLPGVLWYVIFCYLPMGGLSLAFKTYKANLGIWGSPWVGLQNYEFVFRDPAFFDSIGRTLSINLGRMIFEFPFPILLALFINEIRCGKYQKFVQTVCTFPHFLSWIVIAAVLQNFLGSDGMINRLVQMAGGEPVGFLSTPGLFQPMLYLTAIWKSSGWNAIIYLAAISGIDTEQFEAAEIDGCSRWQRIWYLTLPSIVPTICIMCILTMGNLMTAGFDQIFNLNNAAVNSVSETLDMYIYRVTFQSSSDFGFSSAVSLLRSIMNLFFLVIADRGSRLMGGNGLMG